MIIDIDRAGRGEERTEPIWNADIAEVNGGSVPVSAFRSQAAPFCGGSLLPDESIEETGGAPAPPVTHHAEDRGSVGIIDKAMIPDRFRCLRLDKYCLCKGMPEFDKMVAGACEKHVIPLKKIYGVNMYSYSDEKEYGVYLVYSPSFSFMDIYHAGSFRKAEKVLQFWKESLAPDFRRILMNL